MVKLAVAESSLAAQHDNSLRGSRDESIAQPVVFFGDGRLRPHKQDGGKQNGQRK